jgi:NitT/TauT family transport system substrate-binding protein
MSRFLDLRSAGTHLAKTLLLAAALGCAVPAGAAEPLRVVGYKSVVEMGPMLVAAEAMPPGSIVVADGGVPDLWPAGATTGAPPRSSKDVADLAGNASTQAVRRSIEHPDLRIILTVTEGNYRLIARRSSGIRTLADLKGKRIVTTANASAGFYVAKLLERVGLSEKDVVIVSAQAGDTAKVLVDGKADALAIWEPHSEQARQRLGADAVEFNEFGVYREAYNLNATTETLADPAKRKLVVQYVRALIGACHDATYQPAHTLDLVARNSGYDRKLLEESWRHHHFPCAIPTDLVDVLADEEKWVAGMAGRPPRDRAELARLIDPSVLAEAMAE